MKYLLLILLMLPAPVMAENNDRCSELTVREDSIKPLATKTGLESRNYYIASASYEDKKPTQIELLTQMVQTQQQMIDKMLTALEAQQRAIDSIQKQLETLTSKRKESFKPPAPDPSSHGCYQWLSDGGREAIPCPSTEKGFPNPAGEKK